MLSAVARQAPQLDISANPKALHYYDCWKGVPLTPTKGVLEFSIDANGYGCVIGTAEKVTLLGEGEGPTAEELRSEAPPA